MRRSGLAAALVAGLAAAACGPDQELYTFELQSDEPPLDVSVREVEREPDRSEVEVRPYAYDLESYDLGALVAGCAVDELARVRRFDQYVRDRGILSFLSGRLRGEARFGIERVPPDEVHTFETSAGDKKLEIPVRMKGMLPSVVFSSVGPNWICEAFFEPLLARRGARRDPTEFYELARFPLEQASPTRSEPGAPTTYGPAVAVDGQGPIEVTADPEMKMSEVTLATVDGSYLPFQDASFTVRVKLLTQAFDGQAWLQLYPTFEGKETGSLDGEHVAGGSPEWQTSEAVFFVEPGDELRDLRIGVMVNGTGTVQVDDLRLVKGPGWTYWRALKQ